ncbi:MAG: 5-(carboxyamino)imidazole ribonucleotide mutase [Candidatus Omnitrophica bacterium]|nr:5-(carboxyamino)imidazole ribonucleotide mutase [Candidatus Omnitrophota bacterium]
MTKRPEVAILMGSDSDLEVMKDAAKVLKENGTVYEMKILSAHRSPDDVAKFVKAARGKGFKVIIAGAGGAAHLAGVIASHTTLPVIGVPMETKELKGLDSLLSTVQMPSGVPVATMSIGRSGAKNAGILALQILSLNDARLEKRLNGFKRELVENIRRKNRNI